MIDLKCEVCGAKVTRFHAPAAGVLTLCPTCAHHGCVPDALIAKKAGEVIAALRGDEKQEAEK